MEAELTVQELEIKLKNLKEQEQINQLSRELEIQKTKYLGKCYATHTFSRLEKHASFSALTACLRRVNEVYLQDGKTIMLSIENIDYRRDTDGRLSFDISYRTSTTVHNWYENFRYEIKPEQYETVKQMVTAKIDLIGEEIRKSMKSPNIIQTNGNHSKEQQQVQLLIDSKMPFIKLGQEREKDTNLSVREILSWQAHPLLIGGEYLINNQYSKEIVLKIANDLKSKAIIWGRSIYERDIPRAEALLNFVNNTNWE